MPQSQESSQQGKYSVHRTTWSKMTEDERAKAQSAINQYGGRTDTVNKVMDYFVKKYGVTEGTQDSSGTNGAPVGTPGTAEYTQNFENSWGAFTQATQDAYAIETKRGEDKIAQDQAALERTRTSEQSAAAYKARQLQEQMNRAREDYQRFVARTNDETTRTLIQNSKDFASKLSAATSAYGQRGLLRSGLSSNDTKEGTATYGENQTYYKIGQDQKIADETQRLNRMGKDYTASKEQTDFQNNIGTQDYEARRNALGTTANNWSTDRAAGSAILGMDLQNQGDNLYNSTVTANNEANRRRAEQDAINRLYGITPSSTRTPYRMGGKYIF